MKSDSLKKGDIVDIIAPSYGINIEEIKLIEKYIKSLGLRPRIPVTLIGKDLFCSNSVEYRFKHIKQALTSEDSKAVWCVRGGYGAAQLMPYLAKLKSPKKQKIFIGFSDITVLHIFLNQKWGWQTIHAPVLWQVIHKKVDNKSLKQLKELLFGKKKQVIIDDLVPLNATAKKAARIKSSVVGGNLSLIQTSIGTNWQLEAKGKILLIEDTDEKTYSYDRMLMHIKQAGLLKGIKALIIGDFKHHKDEKQRVENMLKSFAESLNIPILKTELIGHGITNYPLVIGADSVLDVGKSFVLSINCHRLIDVN